MKRAQDQLDGRAEELSVRIYQHLMAVYPWEYRREYGPAMAQLFRDQCRDAWRVGRVWGLIGLWLRILPDLMKTSLLEHISTLKGRKTMLERISALLPPQSAPRRLFFASFRVVFLLVVATTTLITFLLPESYSSTARLDVQDDSNKAGPRSKLPWGGAYDPYFLSTQFELIRSEVVLGKVVGDLNLDRAWGKKYGGGNPLTRAETIAILKARIDLRSVRNTSLIDIRVFSDEPREAARLANTIARNYQDHNAARNRPEIVDQAQPGLRPVRPNKPLNITLGILGGGLLALFVGAGITGIGLWFGRRPGTIL
jgi:capsular polysaccharide biosynthesis protein